jgi:cobalamin biosynthesis protein CobT
MFDFKEDAFEGADISSKISQMISKSVTEDLLSSEEYVVFTRELDRIEPLETPENINKKWVPEMEEQVSSMTGRMQKDIERIMASQSHVLRTPGHRKGKLHSPSLFRVTQGDPRVFSQKEEHISKDTAVTLLIDNSGSMSGAKMKLAMLSGYALAATLDRVKIAHEVLGFTTGGWGTVPQAISDAMAEERKVASIAYDRVLPIIMPIYKSFDERMSPLVKKRIAYAMNAQNGLNGNIDGESLEYAAIRLARRPEKRKVMLVLSDGQPAGGPKGDPHLRYVIDNMEKKMGIETVGIGIMDSSVRRYYPKHVVLNKAEDLPGQVMSEIKKLLI